MISKTLNHLFIEDCEDTPNERLLQKMREELDYDDQCLCEIEEKLQYFKYVKYFYKLQRFNEERGLANFHLFPIYKHGRHHIRIDSQALMYLLASVKLGTTVAKNFNADIEWPKYFDYKKLETKTKNSTGR